MHAEPLQLCPTLWDPMDSSLTSSSSMGFSRQEYWNGLPCPASGDLPNPGIKPGFRAAPALWVDSLLLSHWESPIFVVLVYQFLVSFYTIQKIHLLKVFFISLHGSVLWYSFFQSEGLLLHKFLTTDLLVMISFNSLMSEICIISHSCLKNNLTIYRILGW